MVCFGWRAKGLSRYRGKILVFEYDFVAGTDELARKPSIRCNAGFSRYGFEDPRPGDIVKGNSEETPSVVGYTKGNKYHRHPTIWYRGCDDSSLTAADVR